MLDFTDFVRYLLIYEPQTPADRVQGLWEDFQMRQQVQRRIR